MDLVKVVLSVLAGISPPLVTYVILQKSKGSKKDEETIREKSRKIEERVSKLSETKIDVLFPKSAFENLKARKDSVKGEIDSVRVELASIEERIKNLTVKLEEKEKFHQQLKLPNPEVEAQAANCVKKLTEGIELFSYYEKTIADFISKIESLSLDQELEPYKANLADFLLNIGNVTRSLLLMLKDLKEKIEGLKIQIDDLEVEFAKLLEKQVSQ